MALPSRIRSNACLCLPGVALLLAVALPHLDQGDFRTDTAWYAAISLQAARTGSWWTLYAEPGEAYFNKPPLVFWLHAPLLWLTGPRLWAARLPTVLAAAGCVALTTLITRQGMNRAAAAASGCVLALTLEFFRRTREISLDMWQAMFLMAMVLLAARGVLAGRRSLIGLAGVPLGLALLCKPMQGLLGWGVVGVWLVAAGSFAAWGRGAGEKPTLRPLPQGGGAWICALLVAVAVAAPWHVSMVLMHGDAFTGRYFGSEMGARVRGELAGLAVRPQPPWFYIQQIGATYWPWLAVVVMTLVHWSRGQLGAGVRRRHVLMLACLWTGAWLIALSAFPDRRDRYALVIWPGLALMCAAFFSSRAAGGLRPLVAGAVRWAPIAAVVLGLGLAVAPVRISRPIEPQWTALFDWVRAGDGGPRQLWRGGIVGNAAARLYLEFGAWPRPARPAGEPGAHSAEPPAGALLLYHRRGGRSPGPGEVEVFKNGDLTVTRLDAGPWRPIATPDPGE